MPLALQLFHQGPVHKNTRALYVQQEIKTSVEDFYRETNSSGIRGWARSAHCARNRISLQYLICYVTPNQVCQRMNMVSAII